MAEEHKETIDHGLFCARRKDGKCCDGNDHKKCTQDWKKEWKTHVYEGYRFVESIKPPRNFEAHHLLCVASVTEKICGDSKGGSSIIEIIRKTKWCINAEKNMIAMPLWGHTIKFYCDIETAKLSVKERVEGESIDAKPLFKDIPQHDYDHISAFGYQKKDVNNLLIEIVEDIKAIQADHDAPIEDVQAVLNAGCDDMRELLEGRGKRSGGTHKAWNKAPDEPNGDWYLPFSMAGKDDADKRPFPVSGGRGKLAKKIGTLAKRFQKWGAT